MEDRPFPQRVACLGEYFTLPEPRDDGWRPIAELLDENVLAGLVSGTRAAMARYGAAEPSAVPERVAASSLHLSMASRLLSPVVGAFAAGAGVPLLTGDVLRWRAVGHAVHFAATAIAWRDTRRASIGAEVVDRSLVATVLEPIADRLHSVTALSRKVMTGNLMSATNGAVTVMGMTDAGLVPAGQDMVRSMLRLPRLRDTATVTEAGFRRRSCCLFYLAPGGGLCGDCVLQPAAPQ